MAKYFALIALLFLSYGVAFSQSDPKDTTYSVKLKIPNFKNKTVYLGYYWGSEPPPIIDSATLDNNGEGEIKGHRADITDGIYLLGYPAKNNFFEILFDRNKKFSIEVDTADVINTIKFKNSLSNNEFYLYQKGMAKFGKQRNQLTEKFKDAKTQKDTADIQKKLMTNFEEGSKFRDDFAKEHPNNLMSMYLRMLKDPVIPDAKDQPGGKYDTLWSIQYFHDHFWDGVNFWDDRYVRTPFFKPRIDDYFNRAVYLNPDSVMKEMDWMLGYASINKEMNKFMLFYFLNRYFSPRYMWDDKVFAHLYEKYFNNISYDWVKKEFETTLRQRYYYVVSNLTGNPASEISLPDSSNVTKSLYGQNSKFTFLLFWDPNCGHCKQTVPRIDSIYQAKWKAEGVHIFSVAMETDVPKSLWFTYLREHSLKDWTNVYCNKEDENKRVANNTIPYSQLYDATTFPKWYLLDKNKKIIGKNMTLEQVDEIIDLKLKQKTE